MHDAVDHNGMFAMKRLVTSPPEAEAIGEYFVIAGFSWEN
jgi:hypothetical protein